MNKIIIGYNNLTEQKDKLNIKRKKTILNNAIKLCSEYVKIDNEKEFEQSFSKYVVNKITENFGLKNPNIEKIIELTNIPYHKILRIETEYKRIIVPQEQVDYNIYATTEKQVDAFKRLTVLCEELNKWNPKNAFWIERGFNGKIDYSSGKWIPTVNYIKSL
jgi:hypothetical protein